MVRCKFSLQSKEVFAKNDQCERPSNIKMFASHSEPFGKYTPSGEIRMYIQNDDAEKMFEPGKEYYVDFTPVEEQESGELMGGD